jgi:hypothetical protein
VVTDRALDSTKSFGRTLGVDLLRSAGDRRWSLRTHRIRLPAAHQRPFLPPSATFDIPVELATTDTGFAYRGWHPYVETLREYLADPSLRYEGSTLARLHRNFQPANLEEVLFEDGSLRLTPLDRWPPRMYFLRAIWTLNPWLVRQALANFPLDERRGWLYFGPTSAATGETDLKRLICAYENVERDGLLTGPAIAPLDGYFLSSGHSYRFVVLNGNHRVAALRILGFESFPARLRPGYPAVVRAENLDRWTIARGGVYPKRTLEAMFWKLFEETGERKARRLGLTDAPMKTGPNRPSRDPTTHRPGRSTIGVDRDLAVGGPRRHHDKDH